jgi:hypothetical protein
MGAILIIDRLGAQAPVRGRRPAGSAGRRLWWPALVAGAFTIAQLVLVAPGMELGWDETVYVSQVSPDAPTAFFSAPRARGISMLVAPVATITSSTAALRVYLAMLSGAGLLAALWAWRWLRPARVLAMAGLLFAGLWITLFYGPQAMPNLWVALAGLAAVGCFLRAARGDGAADRGSLAGLAGSAAVAAFMRPGDAAWLCFPLVVAALLAGGRRRRVLPAAVLGGLAIGGAEWVIESELRYDGVLSRLHRSAQIEGGIGWHFAVDDQLRSLDGRGLCRPCTVAWQHPVVSVWWLILPVLAIAGVLVAHRVYGRLQAYLPMVCGVSVATPYLFFIGYAAPRFLLPAYALLAIPVADALTRTVRATPSRWRPMTVGLVVVGIAGHLTIQQQVLVHTVARTKTTHGDYARIAADLHQLGVRPPCLLTGDHAIPIAFYARCTSVQTSGNNTNATQAGILAAVGHRPVAVLRARGERPPAYARAWPARALPGLNALRGYRAYLPPGPLNAGDHALTPRVPAVARQSSADSGHHQGHGHAPDGSECALHRQRYQVQRGSRCGGGRQMLPDHHGHPGRRPGGMSGSGHPMM